MNYKVEIPEKMYVDNIMLKKMIFIYNALEKGWTISKLNNKYYFTKKHENQEEVYQENYLDEFVYTNIGYKTSNI
jgi:hypothetical protein|tara:strand:- start:369 stop:593 length:225 start_codon:yes stop_codon:yes gene_type:complete